MWHEQYYVLAHIHLQKVCQQQTQKIKGLESQVICFPLPDFLCYFRVPPNANICWRPLAFGRENETL